MITTKPDVAPDGLYSFADATKALQISRRTIDRYVSKGFIKYKIRKVNNRRVITGAEIIKCWRTVYL